MKLDLALMARMDALLRAAADTEILPRFRNLSEGQIKAKTGPHDLVTEADEAAERYIAARLESVLPGVVLVGEEGVAADPSLLARLATAEAALVLDPIDGTANFAGGIPLFACMAALIINGETIAAWIHDALRGETAMALRGEGAWIEAADGARRDLRVATPTTDTALMTATVSARYMPASMAGHVRARLHRIGPCWELRCGAHEYLLAARGVIHALVYWRLYPWDHAPGALLHTEAGGYSARFDGSDYLAAQHLDGGLICAADRAAWQAVHAALLEGFAS
jgi:fructose-1,6-bisphosphatase/inositol monophosphatase family enzyme